MDLHGKIINIQANKTAMQIRDEIAPMTGDELVLAYKIGHRDARHESAELAILNQVKTIDVFKSWLEKNNISYDTIDVVEWINEINEE